MKLACALALPMLLCIGAAEATASEPQERLEAQSELDATMRSAPDFRRGAAIFPTCAECHGPNGAGAADGSVPRIAGQHRSVVIKQLVLFRHDDRWDPVMEHFADWTVLSTPQAIADVAGYVSGLRDDQANNQGTGESLQLGRSRYSSLCARCHGASGAGNASGGIPRVAGQHFAYLERQIFDAVGGRRPDFTAAHVRLLQGLDRDGIEAVADYMSRLKVGDNPAH